jgi:mono/diheme cytochrome c family protein
MDLSPGLREISALFEPDADLSAVIARLQQVGVARERITLCSPLPLVQASPTKYRLLPYVITIVAGIVGIGVGVFFAAGTAALYPLMTGGKGIVAAPVVGIISYETMMLLAVLATFITMIVRIVRDRGDMSPRDHRIDDGMAALIVPLDTEGLESDLLKILKEAGGRDISIRSTPHHHPGWEPQSEALVVWTMVTVLYGLLGGCSRDMQEQPSYQPQEAPRLHSPAGSVPRESRAVLSVGKMQHADAPVPGEGLYRVNCLHCHGPGGEGNGPVAAYLKEKPANLRSYDVQDKTQEELYDIVSHGKDVMPAFQGELSADDRWTVAGYVKRGLIK